MNPLEALLKPHAPLSALVSLLLIAAPAAAQDEAPIDRVVPYSGLLDLDGAPYDGPVQMRFRLYTAAEGRQGDDCAADPGCTWQETHPAVEVRSGRFAVDLGRFAAGLAAAIQTDRQLYVEMAVRRPEPDDPPPWITLGRRQPLAPAPLSMYAVAGVPRGAVMFFALDRCPLGWAPFEAGHGRYVVGLPPGGTLGARVGQALADAEDRPVGQHTHAASQPPHTHEARDLGHGHELAQPIAINSGGDGAIEDGSGARGRFTTRQGFANIQVDETQPAVTVEAAGAVPGTPAPYVQLRICIRQ